MSGKLYLKRGTFQLFRPFFDAYSLGAAGIVNNFIIFCLKVIIFLPQPEHLRFVISLL